MSGWQDKLPDEVELLADEGTSFRLKITMPTDDEGRIVVQCPTDPDHRFAIHLRFEGESADDVYCVACGHRAGADAFLTDDTRRRIIEIAQATTTQQIAQQMRAMGLDYRPAPMPTTFYTYEQEKTRRTMQCGRCGESVAVFGPAFYCPGCGRLAPIDQFTEQIAIERRIVDGLATLPGDTYAQMEADGALTTIYEGSIKNTVTALEVFFKAVFEERAPNATAVLKAEKRSGNVFQRLSDVKDVYHTHLGIDLPHTLANHWSTLRDNMAARHVLTHNAGIVDQKYLDQIPTSPFRIGQRIVVNKAQVDALLDAAEAVGTLLAPKPSTTP